MVLEKVKMILSNQFDVEEDSITPETNVPEGPGAAFLDVVDMLMSLEDEFDVEIPDDEIEKIRTVGDLVTYIEENMQYPVVCIRNKKPRPGHPSARRGFFLRR